MPFGWSGLRAHPAAAVLGTTFSQLWDTQDGVNRTIIYRLSTSGLPQIHSDTGRNHSSWGTANDYYIATLQVSQFHLWRDSLWSERARALHSNSFMKLPIAGYSTSRTQFSTLGTFGGTRKMPFRPSKICVFKDRRTLPPMVTHQIYPAHPPARQAWIRK